MKLLKPFYLYCYNATYNWKRNFPMTQFVRLSVSLSVINSVTISLKSGKFHFHAPSGARGRWLTRNGFLFVSVNVDFVELGRQEIALNNIINIV